MNPLPSPRPNPALPAPFPHPQCTAWGEDIYGIWTTFELFGVAHTFRWIPPGTFWMGSPEGERGRFDLETRHAVTLSEGFWLGETTVTQKQWLAVTGESPSKFKGDDRPVEQVSWEDAQSFCQQLSRKMSEWIPCLPTEAQWEYACRAGTVSAFSFGDKLTPEHGNYSGKWGKPGRGLKGSTKSVYHYAPNSWGLYQMHGNVWEWCQDAWQDDLGEAAMQDSVINIEDNKALRVVRGGSWIFRGRYLRSASRLRNHPSSRSGYLGLRVCLAPVHQSRAAEPTVTPGGAGSPRSGRGLRAPEL